MSGLTADQYAALLAPLHANRVRTLNRHTHLEGWDVRRHLIRIFGFGGWDFERVEAELISAEATTKKRDNGGAYTVHTVAYRVVGRLTIKDAAGAPLAVYEDAAVGGAVNQPSLPDAHDHALKTAFTQALKRCAANLGDQFGMSLYNGGQLGATVLRTLVEPDGTAEAAELPADAEPVQGEPDDEPEPEPARPAGALDPNDEQIRVCTGLQSAIAEAKTRAAAEDVWPQVKAAVATGQITAVQGNHLRDVIARHLAPKPKGEQQ